MRYTAPLSIVVFLTLQSGKCKLLIQREKPSVEGFWKIAPPRRSTQEGKDQLEKQQTRSSSKELPSRFLPKRSPLQMWPQYDQPGSSWMQTSFNLLLSSDRVREGPPLPLLTTSILSLVLYTSISQTVGPGPTNGV